MPNPDQNQDPKLHVQKVFENIGEHEGPVGVNSNEEKEESMANANANNGGLGAGGGNMGDGGGKLGGGGGLGNIKSQNTEQSPSENTTTTTTTTAETTASDNKTAPLSGTNDGVLSKGSGTEVQSNEASAPISAGNTENGIIQPKTETGENTVKDAPATEKKLEEIKAVTETQPGALGEAEAELKQMLSESADKTETKSGAGSLSKLGGGGSASKIKKTATAGTDKTKTAESSVDATKPAMTEEERKKYQAEQQQLNSEFAGSLGDAGKTPEVQVDPAVQAETDAGRKAGLDLGRINGLGQLICTNSAGAVEVKSFPVNEGEVVYSSLQDYNQKKQAELESHTDVNFKKAYNQAYNEGYYEGIRLKAEVENRKKQEQEKDPKFAEGKLKGIEAGTLAASDDAADRTRAAEISKSIEGQTATTPLQPTDPVVLLKKGFNMGYNKGYGEGQAAKANAKKAADEALLANPEFRGGYDAGHAMGMAKAMGTAPTAEMTKTDDYFNNLQDRKSLQVRGYLTGYNKGYMDGQTAKVAERNKSEELLKSDPHHNAGMIKGTLEMIIKTGGFPNAESLALKVLKGEAKLSDFAKESFPIPTETLDYFKKDMVSKQTAEDKKKFNTAYFRAYNTYASQVTGRQRQQKEAADKGDERYLKGVKIGEVAGAAAILKENFKKKISALTAARLAKVPAVATVSAEEKALEEKIKQLTNNLQTIQNAIDLAKDAKYSKGYYEAYNKSYYNEIAKKQEAQKTNRKNQIGTSSDEFGANLFQQGLESGRNFGIAVFNARKLPVPPADLASKIQEAFAKALGKGAEFNNGFTAGYNEKVYVGAAVKEKEELKGSKKAALDQKDALRKGNKEEKQFFDFGREEAYEEFYNYYKIAPSQRKGGLSLEEVWNKKKIEPKQKQLESEVEDLKEENEIELPDDLTPMLVKSYINGYEAGKFLGEEFGNNYLAGYQDAMSGKPSNAGDRAKYAEGYKNGAGQAQYQNFQNQVLGGLNLATAEEKRTSALSKAKESYRLGYDKHYNQWLKIYTLKAGLQISKDLESLSIEGLEVITEKEETGEKPVLNLIQQANYALANEAKILTSVLTGATGILKDKVLNVLSAKFNISEEDIPESKYKPELDKELAEFKKGYETAMSEAQKSVISEQSEEADYQRGFLMGYKKGGAPLPDGMLVSVFKMYEALPETDLAQDLSNKSYLEGRERATQLSAQVLTGTVKNEDLEAEMFGPAYNSGFQMGKENAIESAESYETEMAQKGNAKEPEKGEQRKSLNGEALQGYDDGWENTFNRKRAYFAGYFTALGLATNGDSSAQNIAETPSEHSIYAAEYQQGFVAGREQGNIDRIGGKENQSLLRNAVRQQHVAELRKREGDAYADAYEKGFENAFKKASENKNPDVIKEFKTIAEDGPAMMPEGFKACFKPLTEAFMSMKYSSAAANPKAMAEKYKKILDLDSKLVTGKDKKPKETLAAFKTILNAELNFTLDNETEQTELQQKKKEWLNYLSKFSEGYEMGFEQGITDGFDAKAEAKVQKGAGEQFLEQSLTAISNQAETSFVSGYSDGGKLVRDLNKKKDLSEPEMLGQKFNVINIFRKFFNKSIENEYKDFKKQAPSRDNENAHKQFKSKMIGYVKIFKKFKDKVPLDYKPSIDMDQFIDAQADELNNELKGIVEGIADVKAFFTSQLEGPWKKMRELFLKGFEGGFLQEIQNELSGRSGLDQTGSGLAISQLETMHDLLAAHLIEDGDIADIDWLEENDELRREIYKTRSLSDLEKYTIYDTNEVIFDLKDEVNLLNDLIDKKNLEIANTDDEEDIERLNNEIDLSQEKIGEQEVTILEQEATVEIASEKIDEYAKSLLQFTSEKINFTAPETTVTSVREYLLNEEGRLELSGAFSDMGGNATVSGPGSLVMLDKEDRWRYMGQIAIALGDLRFKSAGIEVFNNEHYVELSSGLLKVPVPASSGGMVQKSVDFDYLDLEMGLSMLTQIDEQLDLGDLLQKGSALGNTDIGGGFGGSFA